MEQECYEFMSGLMITLFNSDHLITYDYLTAEMHISRTSLSAMKRGRDMRLRQYARVLTFILEMIHLRIQLPVLLLMIGKAITDHCDLVIAVVPHRANRTPVPKEWTRLTKWEDTRE